MVRTILLGAGALVTLVVVFVIWRIYATIAGGSRTYRAQLEAIAPVTSAIDAGRAPAEEDLLRFARDRTTRQVLHDVLTQKEKLDLFPRECLTWPAMAEANMVAWLCHPNELQTPPDEIELMATLPAPGSSTTHYFLFRYRTNEPHWAAKDGWMAGVAGPYDLTGPPVPIAPGTFSRFEKFESRTPEQHVAIHHRLVIERKSGEPTPSTSGR
jgi:hypothetical protein